MNQAEQTNYNTFSSLAAQQEYDKVYLKNYEKIIMERYFKPGMKVLDLGCGAGRTTGFIKNIGCEVIGVDISDELIKLAKDKHPNIDFRVGNAVKLDFPSDFFDIVFFSFNGLDCLYPEKEREDAIFEIKRILKIGGVFIYSSHNCFNIPRTKMSLETFFYNLVTFKIFGKYRIERHKMGPLILYYSNQFKEVKFLRNIGFTIDDLYGVGDMAQVKNRLLLLLFSKHLAYIAKKL